MGDLDRDSERLKGFSVFYTDYDSYYINYLCDDMLGGMMKNEWFAIYTRDQLASDEVMDMAKAKVAESIPQYDLDSIGNLFLYNTNQKNCEYDWKY